MTLVYDRVIAQNVDPIEKKPLFQFLPGSFSYSIATPGCNFRCKHCQNADISQLPRDRAEMIPGEAVSPQLLVTSAARHRCASISYTCGARLQPVLDSIRLYKELGIWIEITTLVIPGHNDSEQELRGIADFIRSVGADVPWHVTRFHPTYKLIDQPRTPLATLKRARQIGRDAGLRYVYEGNIPGEGEETFCWNCGKPVVKRYGFSVAENNMTAGACKNCQTKIDGVWQ
jgi:pyruvate-formate lyase-activating enzyme